MVEKAEVLLIFENWVNFRYIIRISEKTKDVGGITILGKNSENLGACYILV